MRLARYSTDTPPLHHHWNYNLEFKNKALEIVWEYMLERRKTGFRER